MERRRRKKTVKRPIGFVGGVAVDYIRPSNQSAGCPFCPDGEYSIHPRLTPSLVNWLIPKGFRFFHGEKGAAIVSSQINEWFVLALREAKIAGQLDDLTIRYLLSLEPEGHSVGLNTVGLRGEQRTRNHSLRKIREGLTLVREFSRQPFGLSKIQTRKIQYALRFLRLDLADLRELLEASWRPCSSHMRRFINRWATWNSLGHGRPRKAELDRKRDPRHDPTGSLAPWGAATSETDLPEDPLKIILDEIRHHHMSKTQLRRRIAQLMKKETTAADRLLIQQLLSELEKSAT